MAGTPHVSGTVVDSADLNDRVKLYERSATELDLVNSAVETNLYTAAIGAGHMSTDRALRCTVVGDYLNNTGVAQSLLLGIYMASGGTPLWKDTTTATLSASATRREWRMTFEIACLASASVQKLSGLWVMSNPTAGTFGIGDIDGGYTYAPFGGAGTQNTAAAWTLFFTAQHGAANASLSIRKKYALLELC